MQNPIEVVNTVSDVDINESAIRELAEQVITDQHLNIKELGVIIVDDARLKELHRDYLDDDTATDVITFDLSESNGVEGEIYISVDRARHQASTFGVSLSEELARLVIHGILHLSGMNDHSETERHQMRQREDQYLQKYADFLSMI